MTNPISTNPLTKRTLGKTELQIAPLVFGGNVFGWTADKRTSFALLDRYLDAGLNAVDTAEVYSAWIEGNSGGESEEIIGEWLKAEPSRREKLVLITKVGAPMGPDRSGLSAKRITDAVEGSLRRLQTDHIDLYFSHFPDEETPIEETLKAHNQLIEQGKVRAIGASNYSLSQLQDAKKAAKSAGMTPYQVLQPEYNLYDRASFEQDLQAFAVAEELGVITYYSLASGFLSGKYRSKEDLGKSARGSTVEKYLNERGLRILSALEKVSKEHSTQPVQVALAWLMTREGVTAPIASATSIEQLDSLIAATRLTLTPENLELLEKASAPG